MKTTPPRNHKDLSSKVILTHVGPALARFFADHPEAILESIQSPELHVQARSPDLLLRVRHPERGAFHVLMELQVNPDPDLPYRLAIAAAVLLEKHRIPVLPVVVYLAIGRGKRPGPLVSEVLGNRIEVGFREIVLPDWEALDLLSGGLEGPWWPFAVFARGGREPEAIERLIETLRTRPDAAEIVPTVLSMAAYVVDKDQIRQLLEGPMFEQAMRKLEPLEGSLMWEIKQAWRAEGMALGREEGREAGREAGREEGREAGREEGHATGKSAEALVLTRRLIARKFGLPDPALSARLDALDIETLENLAEAMLDLGTRTQLESWLDRHAPGQS